MTEIKCPLCGKMAEVFEDGSASCSALCLAENIGKFGTSFTIGECAPGIKGSSEKRPCVIIQVTELVDLGGPARFFN